MKNAIPSWRSVATFLFASILISANVAAQTVAKEPVKGLLYEVKLPSNTVYVFGSIHLAKADFYPLPEAVEAAYRQADVVAVEVDASDTEAMKKVMPLMTYAAPDKLQNHVTAATWQKLQATVGQAAEHFQPMRPAVLTTVLVMGLFTQQGYDPKQGIDLHFLGRAKADQKKLIELETMESRARMLNDISDEDGDAMVSQTLDGLRSGELIQDTNRLMAAWKSGDAIAVASLMREAADKDAGSKKLLKRTLDDRNVRMAEKISQLLARGDKAFVVVGAGHLAGQNSVTELLRKQGLQVRQIQ